MSLYDKLGANKNDSQEEIKQAWKSFAQKNHPDKNGGKVSLEFEAAREAYKILSDPAARRHYDETGSVKPVQKEEVRSREVIRKYFMMMINEGVDVTGIDAVVAIQHKIREDLVKVNAAMADAKKKRDMSLQVEDQLSCDNADTDLFQAPLVAMRRAVEGFLEDGERDKAMLEKALEILSHHNWSQKARLPGPGYDGHTYTGGGYYSFTGA